MYFAVVKNNDFLKRKLGECRQYLIFEDDTKDINTLEDYCKEEGWENYSSLQIEFAEFDYEKVNFILQYIGTDENGEEYSQFIFECMSKYYIVLANTLGTHRSINEYSKWGDVKVNTVFNIAIKNKITVMIKEIGDPFNENLEYDIRYGVDVKDYIKTMHKK